jgi:hypothetical protein
MRDFREEILKMLDSAYIADDVAKIEGGDKWRATSSRVKTLKEVAKLLGISHLTERRRCAYAGCPIYLERGDGRKYHSNACRQKAYRIRHGQVRK